MLLYNLGVRAYGLVIRAASFRDPKAQEWVKGRRDWRERLRRDREKLFSGEVIWVHCASYGEFEQGRPLIEGLRKKYPACSVLLTFFSPSGYRAFSNWAGADLVSYLPLDTARNAHDFVSIVKPRAVVFIKYEFWLNYLKELRAQDIRTFLVSAVFKPHHPFFKWYGGPFRRSLATFTHLFIQDEPSATLLRRIGITNFTVEGDTRFDRVLQVRSDERRIPELETFRGSGKLVIAGSTWPKDEDLLIAAWKLFRREGVKLVIVPHDIGAAFINELEAKLRKAEIPYSKYSDNGLADAGVLIFDTMGLLSHAYRYAACAYIGGGFDGGVHNCLEAAVYGIPLNFVGDHRHKFNEVGELLDLGAAVNVNGARHLAETWSGQVESSSENRAIAERLASYFSLKANSTGRILERLIL